MSPTGRKPRGSKSSEDTSASEAKRASEVDEGSSAASATASDADVSSEPAVGEEALGEDAPVKLELEAESSEVEAEAAALTEGEVEEEAVEAEAAPKPARRRRRGGGGGEPEVGKPAAPAPSRRRAKRDPSLPAPVVRAQAKYVRSSPRKARLVCDHIRGKTVDEARAILAHAPRAVARDWSKLLESAVANAEHNHELVGEDLYVKAVHADDGPTIKRFRPRAMGRATKIRKRTSHLTILLTPKDN